MMIPDDKPESLERFIDLLHETFPDYEFHVTPAVYDPDTFEPMRGIMVRTSTGNERKLRTVLRGGMKSDIAWSLFFTPDPTEATISAIEKEVMQMYLEEIRKELEPV